MDNIIDLDFDFYKFILKKEHVPCMLLEQSISEFDRALLINWITSLGCQFSIENLAINLTAFLIDKFLSKKVVVVNNLQLVAAACFSLACKYDANYPPKLFDIVYSMDGTRTQLDLSNMEVLVLNTIDFDLTSPTANTFLCNLVNLLPNDFFHEMFNASSYYIELFLLTSPTIQFPYSLVAASSLVLSRILLDIDDFWPENMKMVTNLSLCDMYDCIVFVSSLVSAACKYDPTKTVREKYSHRRFNSVAKLEHPDDLLR